MKIHRWIFGLAIAAPLSVHAQSPGALDPAAVPSLWQPGVPVAAGVSGGRAWIAGISASGWQGFRRAEGSAVGDLLWLGEDGGVAGGWPGYLAYSAPFPLESGGWLAKADSGVWWRLDATGAVVGRAFPGVAGPVELLFENEGLVWVRRRDAAGQWLLEAHRSADGSPEPGVSITATGELDAMAAAPAADGGVWVIAGKETNFWGLNRDPEDQFLFRLRADGSVAAGPIALAGDRTVRVWSGGPGVRLCLGPAASRWAYWPSPEVLLHTLQWRDEGGALLREANLTTPLGRGLVVAEAEEANLVAGPSGGILRKHLAAGGVDEDFEVTGVTRSIVALPDGRWLADGSERLLADGSPDATWTSPGLEEAAAVRILRPAAGGKIMVAGEVDGHLALLRPDGSADSSFVPDARLGRVIDIEPAAGGWLVVTAEPFFVRPDFSSNLVKLRADGSLDENFTPEVSAIIPQTWVDGVTDVAVLAGGDLLVTTLQGIGVRSWTLHRLAGDGSRRTGPNARQNFSTPQDVLPLSGGGYVRGGIIHASDGSVTRNLSKDGVGLTPLAEWRGGVLFLERAVSATARLRWWKGRGWVAGFRAPVVSGPYPVTVAPGESGNLYVHASLGGSRPALRRLLPSGQLDRTFRSAVFVARARTDAGPWWTLGENGRNDLREAPVTGFGFPLASWPGGLVITGMLRTQGSDVSSLLWSGGRLWVGGAFHEVDGQPRTGVARIFGGKAKPVRR